MGKIATESYVSNLLGGGGLSLIDVLLNQLY